MGEKVTEDQVINLLAHLRTDASVDSKVAQITAVKSGIKQNNVPETCIQSLFEAIRVSMSTQHAQLVTAGFSTLTHLLTRLSRQEPKWIVRESGRTLPLVLDKMGDQKEKYRQTAVQCLTTIWKVTPMDVERIVKSTGLAGKNPRMKEGCVSWIVQMHEENGMAFKGFVSPLMELLEDADAGVREIAKQSVIALFRNASNPAKSDLKKQLKTYNVRPAIVAAITSTLAPSGSMETEPDAVETVPRKMIASLSSPSLDRSESTLSTAASDIKIETVEPSYVNTRGELEETFREMHQWFEGKESEANWFRREQTCTKIRRLIVGNALTDFCEVFLASIKGLLDGILKAINSLRTSLSKEGCSLIQELARAAGPLLDPMVEILLQNLIKLCGGTKKISSQNGNVTVDIIISKISYSLRIMQHIWSAAQDKNVMPRTYAAGWLKTMIGKEAHHKSHIEHTGGLDIIEKCIKKGLADGNPGVRESMRSTYWTFSRVWPARADAIMGSLDTRDAKLLEMAPDNPNSPKKADAISARPGLGFSKSISGPSRPTLRETMLAQKKVKELVAPQKSMPVRPGSAMSSFSPVKAERSTSNSSTSETHSARQRPETAAGNHGGLSVAPMRPTKFRTRPEIARPATAGPYSIRRPGTGNTESNASPPATTRQHKPQTPALNSNASPKRAAPRPATSHSNHASQSSHTTPPKSVKKNVPSLHNSPTKAKTLNKDFHGSSPSRNDEELTMVVPSLGSFQQPKTPASTIRADSSDEEMVTPIQPVKVYEDPFSSADDRTTPRPIITAPVLEEVPANEDASHLTRGEMREEESKTGSISPEKLKQNSRLLDSGISKIKAKTLDVHGFRKLQGLVRDSRVSLTTERINDLVYGMFDFLKTPTSLTTEKMQDIQGQILATIKLLYKKDPASFRPYVSRGVEALIVARSNYDSRTHIVGGLELLAKDFVTLATPDETIAAVTTFLRATDMDVEGCRMLSMGLHVLKELLEVKVAFHPSPKELDELCGLATRCLESAESGVRMDAVLLCVSVHARVGDEKFWGGLGGIKDDPKSLITYYIVKRQREDGVAV